MGLAGSLLLALGALGAGAVPLPNPLAGLRLVGLPARNPTISLAVAYAGVALVVLAWSRIALQWRARRPPSRPELARAAATWAAPLLFAPPLFSRDVYSYLAQGEQRSEEHRLNSSHANISYAVFCLKKKKKYNIAAPFTKKINYKRTDRKNT